MNAPIEGLFVTVSVLLLAGMANTRPRRRFCERWPFAPRCLGVAAKRDVSNSHHLESDLTETYKKLQSLLDQYHTTESQEYWDNGNPDEQTVSEKYDVPYQLIKQLMRRRRNPSIPDDPEIISPDLWPEYE